jgi:diacylglycerol kinase (ATP)
MGGEVSARAKNAMKILGGKAAFFWATLKVISTYRGRHVELELDGEANGSYKVLNVAVGNGPFHGGGMHVCPDAVLHDGILNVTVIDDLSLVTLLRDNRYLYDGKIYDHPKIRHFRAKRIVATSPQETRIEVDGEPLGRLPVEIIVLPRAMHVVVPRNSRLLL